MKSDFDFDYIISCNFLTLQYRKVPLIHLQTYRHLYVHICGSSHLALIDGNLSSLEFYLRARTVNIEICKRYASCHNNNNNECAALTTPLSNNSVGLYDP